MKLFPSRYTEAAPTPTPTETSVGKAALSQLGRQGVNPVHAHYEELRRTATLVGTNASGSITAAAGEAKRIATYGLSGCTAVAVVLERADGTRTGHIQHYDPLNGSLGSSTLAHALLNAADAVSAHTAIMTPGEYSKDPEGKWELSPTDSASIEPLVAVARQYLGADAKIKIHPYLDDTESGFDEAGAFMIEFPPDGGATIFAEDTPIPLWP